LNRRRGKSVRQRIFSNTSVRGSHWYRRRWNAKVVPSEEERSMGYRPGLPLLALGITRTWVASSTEPTSR